MNGMSRGAWGRRLGFCLLVWVGLSLAAGEVAAAAKPKLLLSKVSWLAKKHQLIVKGKLKNAPANTLIEAFGIDGLPLGTSTAIAFSFTIPASEASSVPCSVRVQAGNLELTKVVTGNPNKACIQTPKCQITVPGNGISVKLGDPVTFSATAKFPKKGAKPKYEWDFGGGVMGEEVTGTSPITTFKHPDSTETTVKFVRDNSRYRVHFSAVDGSVAAMESKQYRCADSVEVVVGSPPADLPDMSALVAESQATAPAAGSQLSGNLNDLVVLPYPNFTFQNTTDSRFTPNVNIQTALGPLTSLHAQVYRKDRKPLQPLSNELTISYRSASNPADPVGTGSINSTGQNWPLNPTDITKSAPLLGASIQKTDVWEALKRPPTDVLGNPDFPVPYTSYSWMGQGLYFWAWFSLDDTTVNPVMDEGIRVGTSPNPYWETLAGGSPPSPPFADNHGRYLPGREHPYSENKPQDFTTYDSAEVRFMARNIPVTDIDDGGRVNPYPLMRVEVVDKTTQQAASVDAVVSSGKDFHCRGCHAKGKIAAQDDPAYWSQFQQQYAQAYHSSPSYGPTCQDWYNKTLCSNSFTPPPFKDATDRDGHPSNNLFDEEYAAIWNAAALHDFYDNIYLKDQTVGSTWDGNPAHGYIGDGPWTCLNCHMSLLQYEIGMNTYDWAGQQRGDMNFLPRYSQTMHRFHAELQLDPNDPSKIQRGSDGRPLRWDPAQGPNPNTLFPAVSAEGTSLPMEQSCLRCHAGHRDPLYRDRMYTAGVTCYDCHGDMLAVGQAYDKPKPGPEGFATRMEWYEQPDCGSCHTGDANQGKDAQNGYFSAGVLKRAFAANDPSAAPLIPKTPRFAVQPGNPIKGIYSKFLDANMESGTRDSVIRLSSPLYRNSRDTHGNVACGACHGGAHEVWPNRDPNANDNVTALQLQGHTGQILECNVCHTADSFKELQDLDGGRFMTELASMTSFVGGGSGVLGGPHNLHPIADENWWKEAKGNVLGADNTGTSGTYGGWHNDMAKQPGKDGEDQCAACHGNDHKGTRLSRTPVDRTFDFRGFNAAKLKKAGFKKKIIKVAAGTPIGCNTCHSIKTSCIGSPAGDQCGQPSSNVAGTSNHDPVIDSSPGNTTAVIGEDYSYTVQAHDPDAGDDAHLEFSLGLKPGPMSIDESTGVVTSNWPMSIFTHYQHGPLIFPYVVTVKDGKGGYATQTVTMTLTCPGGQEWVWDNVAGAGSCVLTSVGARITSTPPTLGLNAGEAYTYDVTARDDQGLPLGFKLTGDPDDQPPPAGMTLVDHGNNTATITWPKESVIPGSYRFKVTASEAAPNTGYGFQLLTLTVCAPPKGHWDTGMHMCM